MAGGKTEIGAVMHEADCVTCITKVAQKVEYLI